MLLFSYGALCTNYLLSASYLGLYALRAIIFKPLGSIIMPMRGDTPMHCLMVSDCNAVEQGLKLAGIPRCIKQEYPLTRDQIHAMRGDFMFPRLSEIKRESVATIPVRSGQFKSRVASECGLRKRALFGFITSIKALLEYPTQ